METPDEGQNEKYDDNDEDEIQEKGKDLKVDNVLRKGRIEKTPTKLMDYHV